MGDWTSFNFILSQILMFIGFLGIGLMYTVKKRKSILIISIIASLVFAMSYIFLSAWVGLAMCIFAIARDSTNFIIDQKRKPENKNKITRLDWIMLAVYITTLFTVTLLTQDGFLSWFAFIGALVFTVSIWQRNILVYKIMGLFVRMFWIIYNASVQNLIGVILEIVTTAITIYGVFSYLKQYNKNKGNTLKETTINNQK